MNEPLKSTRKCEICGKEFIFHRGAGWLYKRESGGKTIWYCGYTCWRQDEPKTKEGKQS